ncbi:MAG: F0F1 ATP synthase subunit epsilon, partial [Lachnospiraceae bacterium]|nr:F0F1 ATP synthase subunit epsilon [Lachnospiraceae bacterium]
IVETEGEKQAALHTGFVEVLQDSIIMLAESVEWPEEIDEKRAEEAKLRAERRINDDTQDHNRAELALKRAVLRLQMCKK